MGDYEKYITKTREEEEEGELLEQDKEKLIRFEQKIKSKFYDNFDNVYGECISELIDEGIIDDLNTEEMVKFWKLRKKFLSRI